MGLFVSKVQVVTELKKGVHLLFVKFIERPWWSLLEAFALTFPRKKCAGKAPFW